MKKAIEVKDLSFAYQDFLVLRDTAFDVDEGSFVGVIGPNGGGKTTLLKIIMGFLKPIKGKIKVFGEQPEKVQTDIGYVPQTVRFDRQFPISVLEVVLMGRLASLPWYGKYKEEDIQIAEKALEKVGLLGLQKQPFGTLSGGQAQRTLIARALASNPKLLLLDEPTTSIDPQAQAEMYALLNDLRGTMTILMVTHDLGVAIEHVEKVICVQNSVITLPPKDVCEHFAVGLYHTPLVDRIRGS